MMHISFYVPVEHAELVKMAMFKAGGGRIGNYDCCSFEIEGQGQFRPLDGSRPFVGTQGNIKKVRELKIEMVCKEELVEAVLSALKSVHPYEVPAYYVTKTVSL